MEMSWPADGTAPKCPRLHRWLTSQDIGSGTGPSGSSSDSMLASVIELSDRLQESQQPLIWIESADVQSVRAAVTLARTIDATVHVAESVGSTEWRTLVETRGYYGTSLAQMSHSARLVIHVGYEHLDEMPLLAERFLSDTDQHLFLDTHAAKSTPWKLDAQVIELGWKRNQWLDRLTRVLLTMRDNSAALDRRASREDIEACQLAELLLSSGYSVWLWNPSEFDDSRDCLIMERILEITEVVNQTCRCSVLPLATDPGRVTANEVLLWLTNHHAPVRFKSEQWQPLADHAGWRLEDWRQQFDFILGIRTLPSDRQLPMLDFDWFIDADCNSSDRLASAAHKAVPSTNVCSVGVSGSGHVTRTDHGWNAYCRSCSSASAEQVSASEFLGRVAATIADNEKRSQSIGNDQDK